MTKANEPAANEPQEPADKPAPLTAGEMAKGAQQLTGAPSSAPTVAVPAQPAPGPAGPKAQTPPPAKGPAKGPAPAQRPPKSSGMPPAAKTAPVKAGPAPKSAPPVKAPAPAKAGPAPQSAPPAKPLITGTAAPQKPLITGTAAPKPPAGAQPPRPAAAAAAAPKSERPDLDAIHKVGAAKGAAVKADDASADRASVKHIPAATIGTPLRAAVQLRRVDPWSVFKITGVLSVIGFLIWMIAIAVLFGILGGMGVWDQINSSFGTLVSADGTSSGSDLVSGGQVFGFAALFGVFGAIVVTAIATICAYIYNVMADTVGGVEITLADLD